MANNLPLSASSLEEGNSGGDPEPSTSARMSPVVQRTKRTPHSQDTIRTNTMQLSNLVFLGSPTTPEMPREDEFQEQHQGSFVFPAPSSLADHPPLQRDPETATLSTLSIDLSASTTSSLPSSTQSHPSEPQLDPAPSGLTILMRSQPTSPISGSPTRDGEVDTPRVTSPRINIDDSNESTVMAASPQDTPRIGGRKEFPLPSPNGTPTNGSTNNYGAAASSSRATPSLTHFTSSESSPLLHHHSEGFVRTSQPAASSLKQIAISGPKTLSQKIGSTLKRNFSKETFTPSHLRDVSRDYTSLAVQSLPAVVLGCLLNILDGLSYGMIAFPASPPFITQPIPDVTSASSQSKWPDVGFDGASVGVSMFFVTTIVAQLVYTFGGSGFAGANGSMMIEVVPFFHILGSSIAQDIGMDHPREVIATTMAAFVFSSLLTGISFFLLGALRLGAVIGFFPRHILVGCIGGVGAFLIETGFAVSLRLSDDEFQYNWATFKFMFFDMHNLALWTIPLALAAILRLITSRWNHQLIFPAYFLFIPIIFYVVVAAARLNVGDLRYSGWIFDVGGSSGDGSTGKAHWYSYYEFLDLSLVRFGPLWNTMPTQFALLFFNILHPPLNVPALSVSLNEDVDTNKELVAHGYSNFLAGLCGSVPNYLVYVNTLLFYRVGGGTRVAGFLLALATFVLLIIGTGPIAFIPVMVVGSLIFVLGIDLVKEALWDTRHRVSRMEYITIVSIMVCMTVWDFVIGVLFGIVVSCFFFVVQNSQRRSIRAFHTGETAMSTVRRPSSQRAYIREVSKQTSILRLQGFLFFGTITYVEETIRSAIEGPSWTRNPVRFMVVDLTLVAGVDMSAAEAFVRIHRLLSGRGVTLVFCGFAADNPIGRALASVDVLGAEGVELFSTFNDAMEWTENAYLRAWFRSQKAETATYVLPGRQDADIRRQPVLSSLVGSPRLSQLHDAGKRTIGHDLSPPRLETEHYPEPYNTMIKAFSSFGDIDFTQFRPMLPYFERIPLPEGHVLWKQGDPSNGLYIIESGILRASYEFSEHTSKIEESMVPGTLAGELSALSGLPRNATAVAERQAVVWKLSSENMKRLELEHPSVAREFLSLVVKAAKIDYDILLAALATRQ